MKKFIPLLIIIGSCFFFSVATAQKSKAYVKFVEPVPKKFNASSIGSTEISIEFKSKKEASAYIELMKNGKLVGGVIHTGKAKKPQIIKLRLKKFEKGNLMASSNYSLKLYLYEGPKQIFTKKIGETITISDIRLSRL